MYSSNVKTVRNDVKGLLREAQEMFREATTFTGVKADDLRAKGLSLLDSALASAQDAQAAVVESGKQALEVTDEFVQENPWRAVAISAAAGLLVGLLVARK